ALSILLVIAAIVGCGKPPKPAVKETPLVILTSTDLDTFDPQIPFEAESGYVLSNIFDTLVELDSSFRLSPGLATGWTNPDDRTWRFNLNENARFSDGTKLKASDVRFSILRLKSLVNSELQAFTQHVASVDVVNNSTIDIKTDIPRSILNDLVFVPILSEKHVKDANNKIDDS